MSATAITLEELKAERADLPLAARPCTALTRVAAASASPSPSGSSSSSPSDLPRRLAERVNRGDAPQPVAKGRPAASGRPFAVRPQRR
jgi:hypothetical protein